VLRCRLKGPALRSVACLLMATFDHGQASYKEPWTCTTPLNKLIDTMSIVYRGRLIGFAQSLATTKMWFETATPTGGASPSAQAIYADAWKEACSYVEGSALNNGLRKLKQAIDELESGLLA
jgi:hypothetical protein